MPNGSRDLGGIGISGTLRWKVGGRGFPPYPPPGCRAPAWLQLSLNIVFHVLNILCAAAFDAHLCGVLCCSFRCTLHVFHVLNMSVLQLSSYILFHVVHMYMPQFSYLISYIALCIGAFDVGYIVFHVLNICRSFRSTIDDFLLTATIKLMCVHTPGSNTRGSFLCRTKSQYTMMFSGVS